MKVKRNDSTWAWSELRWMGQVTLLSQLWFQGFPSPKCARYPPQVTAAPSSNAVSCMLNLGNLYEGSAESCQLGKGAAAVCILTTCTPLHCWSGFHPRYKPSLYLLFWRLESGWYANLYSRRECTSFPKQVPHIHRWRACQAQKCKGE